MTKLSLLLTAVLSGLLAPYYLSMSGDFWRQIPTFFWEQTEVVITKNAVEVDSSHRVSMGKVFFQIVGQSQSVTYSDDLWTRYDFGDVPKKTAGFVAQFAPGTVHNGFISPDRSRVSLGHFPREYGHSFLLAGMLASLTSIISLIRWRRICRDEESSTLANSEMRPASEPAQ